MAKQTQGSMALVGVLSGGIALVAFIVLMVLGGFTFSPALFLALLIGVAVAIFLLKAFHAPVETGTDKPASAAASAQAPAAKATATAAPAPAPEATHDTKPAPAAKETAPPPQPAAAPAADGGSAPQRLDAPRDGSADDLKKIKGVGPKLEKTLHDMGFYHYDQIANWTADEVAWVDENLEGFKGRVSRDNWVEQARTLASGGETEFSKKVDKGDMY